ncbi:MAG: hypothetical protein EBZ49_14300 [Proteobacteria bacterium]|nr:hypothetical protein [Pseudomonadota bacterium]
MKLSKCFAALAVLAMAVVNNVHADQIDNEAHEAAQAPAAVLVRVDQAAKKVHVYRVDNLDARVKARTMDEATMDAYASSVAVDANKVGELDIVATASAGAGADMASVTLAMATASVTAGAGVVAGAAGTGKLVSSIDNSKKALLG